MPDIIDDPVINSPYLEPSSHFAFDKRGITPREVGGRRQSEFFIPVAQPRSVTGKQQMEFDSLLLQRERNRLINAVRDEVRTWRRSNYPNVTAVTRNLLAHWQRQDREAAQRLFFCQIEAAETVIYLTEVAWQRVRRRDRRVGELSVAEQLDGANLEYNDGLPRLGLKIATGGGKTVVMAMLIAWHTLNRTTSSGDDRFSSNFLIIAPGITVRDRLQVLRPEHEASYYRTMDLIPPEWRKELLLANVEIVNYHQFLPRPTLSASRVTRQVLGADDTESDVDIVRRVCSALIQGASLAKRSESLIVINDEAHHCYRSNPIGTQTEEAELLPDEKDEVKRERAAAQVWFNGLKALNRGFGVKRIYDMSATPFFLQGSGYGEGKLFPWVASDFALIDAIECGIVKVPRVPVADDAPDRAAPVFLRLWDAVRDELPKGKHAKAETRVDLTLPATLEQALNLLYASYERTIDLWREADMPTDPTFIVVCSNTNVSKLVYDWIAGWKQQLPDGSVVYRDGALELFRNVEEGKLLAQPRSLLIDSVALESGEGLTDEFRRIAADEIAEFKFQYQLRTGKQETDITDADLLREALNTVGRAGRLGEKIRCVVSVAMLSEGWDANSVTHILGVRAFRSQLLCEQVVGRGLRRTNYVVKDDGLFEAQYADVYGVPFAFIPLGKVRHVVEPPTPMRRVRALEERSSLEILFPRVAGYRYQIPVERLESKFDTHATMHLVGVPTEVEVDPIVGEGVIHRGDLNAVRTQSVAFHLAQKVMASQAWEEEGRPVWLFPQLLDLSRKWIEQCLVLEQGATPQMLLLSAYLADAANKIRMSFVRQRAVREQITPIFDDPQVGTTSGTDFVTSRQVIPTLHSHVDFAALPPKGGWEEMMVRALDASSHVTTWVKNEHLGADGRGLRIPWVFNGIQHDYLPDFIAKVQLADTRQIHLVIEVSGFDWPGKRDKDETMRTFWIPAVNNWGGLGIWEHVEFDQAAAESFDYALLYTLERLGGPYA